MHTTAYIALGSNLPFNGDDPPELLARAVTAMQGAGLAVVACSGVWRTHAWPPDSAQPDYYNAVVALDPAGRSPQQLYETALEIEANFGRERHEKWAPRTLDLDIAALDDWLGTFGKVTLPHPRMHERGFVLAPFSEIAPEWRHPALQKTAAQLLAMVGAAGCRRVGELLRAADQAG